MKDQPKEIGDWKVQKSKYPLSNCCNASTIINEIVYEKNIGRLRILICGQCGKQVLP